MIRIVVTLAVVLCLALSSGAQAPAGSQSARESSRTPASDEPSGARALAAGIAYPGLGQLLNGRDTKAAIIGGIEAFLLAQLLLEDRLTRNAYRQYQETGSQEQFDEYSKHFDRRQTLVWWAAIAALYGIADAYVDAHLVDFDDPLPPGIAGSAMLEPDASGGVRVGFAVRF